MPEISTLKVAELTGADRATVRKYLKDVPFRRDGEGEKATKYYDSTKVLLLRQMVEQDEEKMTPQDGLAAARKREIELKMDILRGERPKLSEVVEAVEDVFAELAGIVKGSALEDERKADIMQALTDGVRRVSQQKPDMEAAGGE